jgi:hypothetical protein
MTWLVAGAVAEAWELRGPDAAPTGRSLPASALFAPGPVPPGSSGGAADLGAVARATAEELLEQYARGAPLGEVGMLAELGVDLDDVLDTLLLVASVAEADRGAAAPRLADPAWLAAHFDAFAWTPDAEAASARKVAVDERIRLTSYAVFEADAATDAGGAFDTALWALPDDEGDGVPGFRTRFTRMDVYAGVYGPGGAAEGHARPLVWLSRADANQALMQGSVVARMPDGSRRTFNVHENNGIPWDPAVRDPNRQARFWYFREVEGLLGVEQIPLRPLVTVAGDVYDHGLGKLFALSWSEGGAPRLQLAVLADTGGAFEPNLFQLDWLAGTFPSMAAYRAWAADAPARVRAHVLIRKEGVAP